MPEWECLHHSRFHPWQVEAGTVFCAGSGPLLERTDQPSAAQRLLFQLQSFGGLLVDGADAIVVYGNGPELRVALRDHYVWGSADGE